MPDLKQAWAFLENSDGVAGAGEVQAAIRRVRDFAADIERSGWTGPAIARRIRDALDEPAPGPAAGGAKQ